MEESKGKGKFCWEVVEEVEKIKQKDEIEQNKGIGI